MYLLSLFLTNSIGVASFGLCFIFWFLKLSCLYKVSNMAVVIKYSVSMYVGVWFGSSSLFLLFSCYPLIFDIHSCIYTFVNMFWLTSVIKMFSYIVMLLLFQVMMHCLLLKDRKLIVSSCRLLRWFIRISHLSFVYLLNRWISDLNCFTLIIA